MLDPIRSATFAFSLCLAAPTLLAQVSPGPGQTFTPGGPESRRNVGGAGDWNGDGFDDVIVGSDLDHASGEDAGSITVYSGADSSVLFSAYGDDEFDSFGRSVSGAGDLNGDGFADIVVGIQFDDENGSASGAARAFSGADGAILFTVYGDDAGDYLGDSVSGAGDLNGDGFDDIVVGIPLDDENGMSSGAARAYSGVDGSVLFTVYGDNAGSRFGTSVSGAGDLNGDGFADIVVGAYSDDTFGTNSGLARTFSGVDGSVLFTVWGEEMFDQVGLSVGRAGDINGDGFDDVVIGTPLDRMEGSATGSARVFSGFDGTVLLTAFGDSSTAQLGTSVAGAGDIDGDGVGDILAGAPQAAELGVVLGAVRAISGADGTVLFTVYGDSQFGAFGQDISGAGDVNGDGFADIIVGTHDAFARLFTVSATGQPPHHRMRGIPCIGGNTRLPRIGLRGASQIGTTPEITLRGGPLGGGPVALAVGSPVFPTTPPTLEVVGLDGCRLYVSSPSTVPFAADANGMANLPLSLANDPGFAGTALEMQWFCVDFAAPRPTKVSMSGALQFVVGL